MEESGDKQQRSAEGPSTGAVTGATKTWGFRRSTIARREFMEGIGNLDIMSLTSGKNTRPAKGKGRGRGRGKQSSESSLAVPPTKRGRGGKKSGTADVVPVPSPASADSHTTPGLSSDKSVELKDTEDGAEGSTCPHQSSMALEVVSDIEAVSEAVVSDHAEDSDELTLRELQERVRNRRKLEECNSGDVVSVELKNTDNISKDEQTKHLQSEQNVVSEDYEAVTVQKMTSHSARRTSRNSTVLNKGRKTAEGDRDVKKKKVEEEENQASRNEEADKTLDESNEEDDSSVLYCICRQRHNNRFMICCDHCQEWFHGDCVGITEARGHLLEKNGEDYTCPSCSPCQSPVDSVKQPALFEAGLSSSSESFFSSSAGEGRPSEDEGIRGKIRKSSSHRIKRRIKIFQKVADVAVMSPPELEEMAKQVVVVEEKADPPKCIGPGCTNNALPESVYCGHQCIIRHAAVAMQSLSEPKPQPEIQTKPAPKLVPKIQKRSFLEKLFRKKPVEKSAEEEDSSIKEAVESLVKEPSAAPQSSDVEHKTVGERQSSAIASSVFYASTIKEGKAEVESKPHPNQVCPLNQHLSQSFLAEGSAAEKAVEETPSTAPFRKPGSNPLPSRAKKTMPGSPRFTGSRKLLTEAPQSNKSTCTFQKKPGQSQETPVATQGPADTSTARELHVLPITPAPAPPSRPLQAHPNMQMRQNIRRSLTDALLKRVIDSDGLDVSESEVGKLAVNIEREMFNMYYTTDNKYNTKYKSLLFSLKDPKNKGLFYQVLNKQITPFKLTRMSQQELQTVQDISAHTMCVKEESSTDVCAHVNEPLSVHEDRTVKTESVAASSEEKMSQIRQTQPRKVSNAVSDIIISMLKDTTAEHRTHLFDLKCRICTGQMSLDDDPETKKVEKEEQKEDEVKPSWVVNMLDKKPFVAVPKEDSPIIESPASPVADDSAAEAGLQDFSPPVIPAVSIVSITRTDPRKIGYRPAPSSVVQASASTPLPTQDLPLLSTDKERLEETKVVEPLALPAPPPMPKSILMKPSATPLTGFYNSCISNIRMSSSHTPTDSEATQFLSKQDTVWKGFLNMPTVAKFVTKGFLISGCSEFLKKDLPDTIHIGGRILPQTVWEYVERVRTSASKELSLIRFHPATDEEEVAYVSLFSYFNSRRRFGVVSNICNNIKDLYLIPLCAKESVPSVLLPIEGPGLEQNHPNLLIGLAICQKLKRTGSFLQEIDEKRPKIHMLDPQVETLFIKPAAPDVKLDCNEPYEPDIPISTTPPGSPPCIESPDSSSTSSGSLSGSSVLSNILSVVNSSTPGNTNIAKVTSSTVIPPSVTCSTSSATPLQTILNTLFGKKKTDSDFTESSDTGSLAVKPLVPSSSVDPIVQQYQQTPKYTVEDKVLDDSDRPYDPEEEYDPAIECQSLTPLTPVKVLKPDTLIAAAVEDDDRPYDPEEEYNLKNKASPVSLLTAMKSSVTELSVDTSAVNDDIAYDPEDETVFEEIQTYLADSRSTNSEYGTASTVSLSEQQRMLEELNRQIEEQKRQLEEQEEALRLQRAAVGVSMAHFSVSDALMSPPPRFGREPEDATEKTLALQEINQSRDPRQCRKDAASVDLSAVLNMDHSNKKQVLTQTTFLSLKNISLAKHVSQTEQELVLNSLPVLKKDSDLSSVKPDYKINTVNTHSTSNETVEFTIVNASAHVQESTHSSVRKEDRQQPRSSSKESGKRRQSHTSRWDNHSSPKKRSRHEHRSYHGERSSHVSKDETDRYHSRGRLSVERSPRRSCSHSNRKERLSSRQRVRQHHTHTSSRHRSRRDQHSVKSYSTQSKSLSRQSTESTELHSKQVGNIIPVASGSPQILSSKSQMEAYEKGEQKVIKVKKGSLAKNETEQSCFRGQSTSFPPSSTFSQHNLLLKTSSVHFFQPNAEQLNHENKPPLVSHSKQKNQLHQDLKTCYHNRDHPEELKDNSQRDRPESVRDRSVFSPLQTHILPSGPHSLNVTTLDSDQHNVKSQSPKTDPMQGDGFSQDASDHHLQSEHLLMQKQRDVQVHSIRDQSCSQSCNNRYCESHTDEQSLGLVHLQRDPLSMPAADYRSKVPQKTMPMRRKDFSELERAYSRNQSLSEPLQMQRDHLGALRSTFPQSEADQIHQNKDSLQKPSFPQDADDQCKQRSRLQRAPLMHKRDFRLDEHDQYHNFPKRPLYVNESNFPQSEFDVSYPDSEGYSGHFPFDETEPHHQRDLLYQLPKLQGSDVQKHEAIQLNASASLHQNHTNSFETDHFHHRDHPSQGTRLMAITDLSQEEHSNFHPRDHVEARAPDDQWRDPQHRTEGIKGPSPLSMMTPRGPAPVQNRVPTQNFGPRGPCLRHRILDDTVSSPSFEPRGPCSGPGVFRGSRPQTFGQRTSSSGPGHLNSFRLPQNFDPSSGSCSPQNTLDGPRDPHQSRQLSSSESRDPLNFKGLSHRQFKDRDSQSSHIIVPRGCAVSQQLEKKQFDSRDSQPPNLNSSQDCAPKCPLKEAIDDTGFHLQHASEPRENAPLQYADSVSHNQNSGSDNFSNPQEPRHPWEFTPLCQQRQEQHRNQGCGNPPQNLPEEPKFLEMESGNNQFNETDKLGMQREKGGSHFAKPDILGDRDCERNTQLKGSRFNPPQNLKGQRAPFPLFHGHQMGALQGKKMFEDKLFSPRFPNPMASTSVQIRRVEGPKTGGFQNRMVPQVHYDGSSKEPEIRPLRLSGPLLPTPPGGPIRLNNPRIQRPYNYPSYCTPPARGSTNEVCNVGFKSACCDDFSNFRSLAGEKQREVSVGQSEDDSSQYSSPGLPWQRRRPRRREGLGKALRRTTFLNPKDEKNSEDPVE